MMCFRRYMKRIMDKRLSNDNKAYRIAWISNILFEPHLSGCLVDSFFKSGLNVEYVYVPYDGMYEENNKLMEASLVVVILNFESMYPNLTTQLLKKITSTSDIICDGTLRCRELYSFIKKHTDAPIVWFGFEDYCFRDVALFGRALFCGGVVDQLNLKIASELPDISFVDFKHLIADVGISETFDLKGKYRWNAPYTKTIVKQMVEEIHKQYKIHIGKTKKCLVLDCDNVLWGGILSEDGIDGITLSNVGLGRPFWDFQCLVLRMYYHGVILAICSKNDEDDVLKVFREHSGMILREEHISCFQCNWDNKPENIRKISESLNISLDSIVFVDDSKFELDGVKASCPEVTTVLYNAKFANNDFDCFNLRLDVDKKTVEIRTNTYRTNAKREELRRKVNTFEEYLRSLDMKLDIHPTDNHELMRVSELLQRANKCTNGVRYTVKQLKVLLANEAVSLYTVHLSDKFSELGIVGAIGIKDKVVELFCLSCRALGRSIENNMVSFVKQNGVTTVRFHNTGKNAVLYKLFEDNGMIMR